MNVSMAAIVAGSAFLLSLLSGLLGGVPLFDIIVRALVWAAVGFGASLGIESLLRFMVPDLFQASDEGAPPEERVQGSSVNIALDDEVPLRTGGFVEEVEDEPVAPLPSAGRALEPQEEAPAVAAPREVVSEPEDEEMPEIGSFLDAFKPEAAETGEDSAPAAAPEYAEYAPDAGRGSPSGEVTIDGEVQDPALLARAVQTVLKRDAQGN